MFTVPSLLQAIHLTECVRTILSQMLFQEVLIETPHFVIWFTDTYQDNYLLFAVNA